jgi:hypothetical protein
MSHCRSGDAWQRILQLPPEPLLRVTANHVIGRFGSWLRKHMHLLEVCTVSAALHLALSVSVCLSDPWKRRSIAVNHNMKPLESFIEVRQQ